MPTNDYTGPGNPVNHKLLPIQIRRMTEGGEAWEKQGYPSLFAARKSVLFHMLIRGWTFDEAYRYILAGPARPVYDMWGSDRRHVTLNERTKDLIADWAQATIFVNQYVSTLPDVLAICGELRDRIENWPWKGVAGRTDRAVILVAISYAEQSGSLTVKLPIREVLKGAGVGHTTAGKSLGRLERDKWISHTRTKRQWDEASQYRINPRAGIEKLHKWTDCDLTPPYKSVHLRNKITATDQGVDLGKATVDVALTLTGTAETQAQIARLARVHPATAGRALKLLRCEGIAESHEYGKRLRWTAGPKALEDYEPFTHRATERAAQVDRDRDAFHYYGPTSPQKRI